MTGTFDSKQLLSNAFAQHGLVLERTQDTVGAAFVEWTGLCVDALKQGHKLMFFGNGGSASDAQHLATELSVRFKTDRPAIAAIALNTDTSALTAAGNDLGFDQVFARQVEALGRPGDVVIGISTSGNSTNVIKAIEAAKRLGCKTTALLGRDGGKLLNMVDLPVVVPSDNTARIQEMHILLGHALCGAIEIGLGYVDKKDL